MTFVDLGAGTGYFTRAAAEIVGGTGRVFAVETSHTMIGILKQRGVGEAARVTKNEGRILFLEWKKQAEEQGPPMEERLGQAELKGILRDYAILEEGSLNESHYYVVIGVRKPSTKP
jgi:ubiquinone/menaquinone biosynthesis C-methylase UbiE